MLDAFHHERVNDPKDIERQRQAYGLSAIITTQTIKEKTMGKFKRLFIVLLSLFMGPSLLWAGGAD